MWIILSKFYQAYDFLDQCLNSSNERHMLNIIFHLINENTISLNQTHFHPNKKRLHFKQFPENELISMSHEDF